MSFDKELAKELDEIVAHGLSQVPIPYEKGNSIRAVSYTHLTLPTKRIV